MEDQLMYLNALRSLPGVGDKTLRKLLAQGQPETLWRKGPIDTSLFSDAFRHTFSQRHEFIKNPEAIYQELKDQDISLVTEENPLYPRLLLETPDHPYLLYVRGSYDFSKPRPLLAVVGTRKCTGYGKQAVESLVAGLTRAGVVIVSGLAFGIDKLAHEACLAAGGETLAVLGSGIDDAGITPSSHRKLGQEIVSQGALISEFPVGTQAKPGHFPMRNRIVAGMTLGVLVIEAPEKSGSLITARLALDYNREVFAIPGSIFSDTSRSPHALIKGGAKITTCLEDILEELHLPVSSLASSPERSLIGLSPLQERVHTLLSHEPLHIDELIERSSLAPGEINSTISILEVRGLIKHIGNKHYRAM